MIFETENGNLFDIFLSYSNLNNTLMAEESFFKTGLTKIKIVQFSILIRLLGFFPFVLPSLGANLTTHEAIEKKAR